MSNRAVGHEAVLRPAGPPWISTTIGYRLPGSKFSGYTNHPCTRKSSLFQTMLSAFPQCGRCAAFACVTWRQFPTGPAQTSGGCSQEDRTTADVLPSLAIEKLGKFPA